MAGGGAGGDLVAAARVHIAIRTAGIAADPRYAAFAREWGVDSPRRVIKNGVVT
jgi:steroid 5-alpha reductase family enzyme